MEWKHLFRPEIVGRGLSYYRLGRVQNLEQVDGEIKAEVIGNDTYSVWIK